MSISDESAGNNKEPRRYNKLSPVQWRQAQIQYETGNITLPRLAVLYNVSLSTMRQRSMNHKWAKERSIVTQARTELNAATTEAIKAAVAPVAQQAAAQVLDDLQPWIEKQKRSHIRSQVKRGKRALSRIDGMIESSDGFAPKDESFIAKSVDTYDNVIRRNLGMSDGSKVGGSLALNILTGQAAVQIVSNPA